MKLKNIAIIATTSILTISSITMSSERAIAEISESKFDNTDASFLVAESYSTTNDLSSFVAVGARKQAEGTFKIITVDEKQYIEFSDDFKVSKGPDLEIILHKNNVVASSISEKDYISLAPIQSFSGNQRYEIPENVNLDDYASVAVWCEDFNVTFGYAEL